MVIVIVIVIVMVMVNVRVKVRKPLTKILHQICLLMTTQYQIHPLNLYHRFGFQLRIAARHHHESPGVLSHHPVNSLTTLMIGHLRHRTSVDQADIRLFPLLSCAHAQLL